jgi:PAS domain S-box-containing protein
MPYEAYFKAASDALIVADRQGQILEANPKAEELFGYSLDELLVQTVEALLPEQIRALHRKHREDFFDAPRSRPMGRGQNLVGRRKDGSEFPVEVSLTYARGTERGDLVVAAVIDITERLALEQEARRVESMTSLGVIGAGIAHDLNNPLQVIRSRAELLLETSVGALAPEMREDLGAIHRQAQRAHRIVEEFLELSRQPRKRISPVDINGLIERALLLIGEQMRRAGIDFETTLDHNLPGVLGDATALERVLINLLTNAREAMPHGGSIAIGSSRLENRSGWIHLNVADNGSGIPPEALSKVFDLRYTTRSGGTGLGLWLSRRIVQEHNGRIEVHSELGKGTVFTVELPALGAGS